MSKVEGDLNLADALTKYVEKDLIEKHMEGVSMIIAEGRHDQMPQVMEQELEDQEDQEEEEGNDYDHNY